MPILTDKLSHKSLTYYYKKTFTHSTFLSISSFLKSTASWKRMTTIEWSSGYRPTSGKSDRILWNL
ncbi:hypothetical protein BOVA514_5189 [Bacteroides ovatus]|nr:hypothetical protein BOVA514_5189 [Bacteroides ovatus]